MTSTMDLLYSSDPAEVLASFDSISAAARATAAEIAASFDAAGTDASGMAAKMDAASAMSAESMAMPAAAAATMADDTKAAAQDAADGLSVVPTAARDAAEDTKAAAQDAADGLKGTLTDASNVAGGALAGVGAAGEEAGTKVEGAADKAASSAEKSSSGIKGMLGSLGVPSALLGGWGALAAGVAGVGAVSLKAATDFQQSMTLLVTGAGESQKNIGMVGQGILNMAGQVGESAKDLAAGMYLIESAGYHGSQGLSVLKAAAEGAAVGGADMSTVAGALTSALHDYHDPASDANDVTSALVETVASGKTTLDALSGSIGRVMPLASNFGVSMQTVLGAMATMTNSGLSAKLASTGLANMLSSIESPSATASAALQGMGLSSQKLVTMIGSGPQGLVKALQDVTRAAGEEYPKGSAAYNSAVTAALGGTTSLKAALALSGSNAAEFGLNVTNIGKRLDGTKGSVQGFSDVQKDLKFQLDSAKDSADAFAIKLGQHLLPAATEVAKELAKFAKDAVADLPAVFSAISKGFDAIKPGLELFAKLAGDAFKFIIDHKPVLIATLGAIAVAFFPVTSAVVGVALAASEVIKHWSGVKDFFLGIKDFFVDTWQDIERDFAPLIDWFRIELDVLVGAFKIEWDAIAAVVRVAWDVIKGVVTTAFDIVKGIFKVGIDLITGDWTGAWNAIKGTVVAVWNDISGAIRGAVSAVASFLGQAWNDISSTVTTVWNGIVSFFGGIPGKILSALESLGHDVENVAKTAWDDFKNAISTGTSDVITFVKGIPKKILTALGDLGSLLLQAGKDIIKGLEKGIEDAAKAAVDAVGHVVSSIVDKAKSVASIFSPSKVFHGIGQNIVQGLANGISDNASLAVSASEALAKKVSSVSFTPPVPSAVATAIAAGGTSNAAAVTAASGVGSAASSGAGTTVISPTINLNGLNFQNEQQLATAVRQQLLVAARQLPGRSLFGQYA